MSSAQKPAAFKRVLGLRHLVLFGITFVGPTAPFPMFGIVSSVSRGHMALAYLIAMVVMMLTDPVLTGQRIVDYDVSRDEAKVAFTVRMGDESQIFLAAADRSSPPRLVVRGGDEVSLGAGQLFFRQVGGNANYLARVQEDGSGLARVVETKTTEIGGVSPDGEWVAVEDIDSVGGDFVVRVRDRAQRKICAVVCYVKWSADGKYLYVSPTSRFSQSESTQPTYIIPMPHGVERLDLPASGIDLANEEQLAGLQSVPQGNMSPGPDPQTYAFTTSAFQGNLFRIPLH